MQDVNVLIVIYLHYGMLLAQPYERGLTKCTVITNMNDDFFVFYGIMMNVPAFSHLGYALSPHV